MNRIIYSTLPVLALLLPVGATASKSSDAANACADAMALIERRDARLAGQLVDQCKLNTRTKEYWQCVSAELRNGEDAPYVLEQCSEACRAAGCNNDE